MCVLCTFRAKPAFALHKIRTIEIICAIQQNIATGVFRFGKLIHRYFESLKKDCKTGKISIFDVYIISEDKLNAFCEELINYAASIQHNYSKELAFSINFQSFFRLYLQK